MNALKILGKNSDLMIAAGIVGTLIIMIVPMPPFLIDIFLSLGISGAVVLLLVSVYTSRVLDFSIFPTLLLITTLFRLSLNVATTRIILLDGADLGSAAAGSVIQAFGEFVVGGNYAVGIIIFVILVIINFIVITKGAGRVAEVAARFTLDAMPGKQMAIDADLNAGIISEIDAKTRRENISQEADFYGAMDGASKFVRGDAIAGIMIAIVNIVGGIVIGTFQHGMSIQDAAEVFTLLTVGDGLVSQVPALIISTAAGIIVTRTASGKDLGGEFSKQLFSNPKAIAVGGVVMAILGTFRGLPTIPFFMIATCMGIGAFMIQRSNQMVESKKLEDIQREKLKPKTENLETLLSVDQLELEVGYGLINIVDAEQNGDLLERITNIRKQFAVDLGIIVPPIRIRDNLELKPGDYQLLLKGVPVGTGSLMVGNLLAMDPGGVVDTIRGVRTKEPAFGLDAYWIAPELKDKANESGYTVVDLSTVIATHLTEIIRQNASELLGRQELQVLLDSLKETAPKIIEDLIPNILPVGTVLKVLKNLLKEDVSIRDLKTILEVLADNGVIIKDPAMLTEQVRASLARNITKGLIGDGTELEVLTLEKEIEETIASGIIQTEQGQQLSVDPEFVRSFVGELNDRAIEQIQEASQAVVLCSPVIRMHLKSLVDRFIPNVTVLSHNEISPNVSIRSIATVRMTHVS